LTLCHEPVRDLTVLFNQQVAEPAMHEGD